MKIAVASDHAGFDLKALCVNNLKSHHQIFDLGTTDSTASVDYPDFANKLAEKITNKEVDFGILICGTGIGISIAANRHKAVRAALCHNQKTAKLSRQHNDANVICLGARIINWEKSLKMIDIFIGTNFEGSRHIKRVAKLSND